MFLNKKNAQFEIYLNDKTYDIDKAIRFNQAKFYETLIPLGIYGLNYIFYQIYGDITGKYFEEISEHNASISQIKEYQKYFLFQYDEKEFKNKSINDIQNWTTLKSI